MAERKYDYSQGGEQIKVTGYFGDSMGTYLDIGANNGITLSNTYALALHGWAGVAIEPSPDAFWKLLQLYNETNNKEKKKLFCYNIAIGDRIDNVVFYESGTHLNMGDTALLSSVFKEETMKWRNVTEFSEIKVNMTTFEAFIKVSPYKTFDFISIDAEGADLLILRQMDLYELGCKCLCIEHNGNRPALHEIRDICSSFGLSRELMINSENIILAQ